MNIKKLINKTLIDCEMTTVDLAQRLGTSSQNIYAKLGRNDMRVSDLQKIADALELDLIIEFREKKSKK